MADELNEAIEQNAVEGIKSATVDNRTVVAMDVARPGQDLLVVTENGFGKRTQVGEYRLQHRGGSGIINMKTTDKNGKVVDPEQLIRESVLKTKGNRGELQKLFGLQSIKAVAGAG